MQLRIRQARTGMLLGHITSISVFSCLFATVMCWLIAPLVDPTVLWPWLAAKWLILVPRVWQARAYARSPHQDQAHWYRWFMVLLVLDSLIWGGVGWWLTPHAQIELGAVTLACVVAVAAAGSFMLHMDARASLGLQLAVIGPNFLYCLARGDQYGLFGALCLAGVAVVLQMETLRAQRRMTELLRLRFALETVARQREEARDVAERLSEAKSRFLATVSHEMRTPLSGMLGLTRMLREEETRPPVRRRLELVERSGEHLLTVLTDVLDFSRIAAGHLQVESKPFDLGLLLDEVLALSGVSAREKGLALVVRSGLPASHPVRGDAMRVRQVLHNLIGNAIKFTEEGQVAVLATLQADGCTVELVVEDTGIGIPECQLAHIFEAFHQVEGNKRRHEGTGLGLTISRQLCQAMGGDLSCTSQVGRGSRFVCTLQLPPATSAELEPVAPVEAPNECPSGTASAWTTCRVLLVEDNPINALVAEASLRQMGVEVRVVDDGAKAVEWLAGQQADLVLMDCIMPQMDGYEATRQIRRRERERKWPRVPIVALTATVDEQEKRACLDAGMDDHLGKPFSREDLSAVLERHLGVAPWPVVQPGVGLPMGSGLA
ncbi:MAG TPA: ATP-binding protein [Aquabacterium sp.]|nr:ATP-binding protein [Aquabacterium sp.]